MADVRYMATKIRFKAYKNKFYATYRPVLSLTTHRTIVLFYNHYKTVPS